MPVAQVEKPKEPEQPKFKFVCHGCTQDALFSTSLMHDIQLTCPHCGLQQVAKPENWVIL